MADDFSSLLTIEVIDHGENDRHREGARCSVCLQSPLDVPASLPRCGHGVCQSCLDLVKRDDSNVFCVICQIRSVSPNPDHGQTSTESWQSRPGTLSSMLSSKTSTSSPSMSSEKQDIVKTQLMKLQHLDDAVYKPLGKHFERLLLKLKKGLDKNVQLVETRFEEIVNALDKRKKKIIRSLKQNTKANKAMVENKKKAMEKERAQLRECRRRHQDKLRLDGRTWKSSDITINLFLLEVDDFQRKARKMSTENSITEFDELEVITNAEEEGSIRTAVEKLVTLRETTQLLKSRVGTPPSSVASSIEESSRSSSSFTSDHGDEGSQQKNNSQRGRPMSLRVPMQPRRTQSLSPNPPCFPRVPVTPRDVRSAADGCEIQDLQTAHFLPDIAQPPSPTEASGSQRPESGRRRQPVPPEENDAMRERSLGDHPGCRFRSSQCLLKRRGGSIKRILPDLSLIRQSKGAPQSHRVKYQTLMLDDVKLQRPCGICCLSNGADEKGVVTVADCGQGQIVNVGLDGQVTGVTAVWEQDDDSVKADGIFDVAQMDGGSVIVSDSYQKEVILFDRGRRLHSLELPANTDPRGVTSQGHRIFICDQGNHCVQMLDLYDKNDCRPRSSSVVLGKPNEHDMVCPYFVSVDRAGERVLVSDYGNGALILARTDNAHPPHRVKLVASSADSKNGRPYPTTNIEIRPTGVAWLPDGRGAVVADQIGHRLVVVDEGLKVVGSYGRQGSGEGEFLFPHGISFVSDGILSVCDMNNARIQFVQLDVLHANLK